MFSLYVIADRGIFASDNEWLAKLDEVGAAGSGLPQVGLQVRIKDLGADAKAKLAARAHAVLAPHRVKALLNGSTSEAGWAEFAGVHWPEALIPEQPTALPPGFPAGASIHSEEAANRARAAGATFLVFGTVFDAGSKPARGVGAQPLRRIVETTALPVIAVGGITPAHVAACLEAGARGVAVVTGIMRARDPAAAINDYLNAIEAVKPRHEPVALTANS